MLSIGSVWGARSAQPRSTSFKAASQVDRHFVRISIRMLTLPGQTPLCLLFPVLLVGTKSQLSGRRVKDRQATPWGIRARSPGRVNSVPAVRAGPAARAEAREFLRMREGPAGCGGTAIKAGLLEEYVTGAVLDALESSRVQEELREGEDQHGPRRAELLEQIRDAQERREEARRDYSNRVIDRADWPRAAEISGRG